MSWKTRIIKMTPFNKLVKQRDEYRRLAKYLEKKYYKANHLYAHFKTQFAPGHFYSPYPNLKDIAERKDTIFNRRKQKIEGIDIREHQQLQLLKKISKFYKRFPYQAKRTKKLRYFLGLHAYSYTDGLILFCMLLYLKPKKIIEIGSGYSSALMLDTKQLFMNNLKLSFIEPYPELLLKLTKSGDKRNYQLIDKPLHEVDPAIFANLDAGDILFIDSTHVAKPGSDVNQIYFKILPSLQKGVIIHIHDVFYPFEYPIEWIMETRAWNEDYLLRAFLYNNKDYKILLFNDFLNVHHKKLLDELMPLSAKNGGGSLWLQKTN